MTVIRKIIFLDNKNSSIRAFVLIAILGLLTVFLIGYLSVDQTPRVYIFIISAIAIIMAMAFFLRNINIAIPVLIILLPITNIAFILKIISSRDPLTIITLIDIFTVAAIICLLLYKSAAKGGTTVVLKKKSGPGYLSLLLFVLVAFGMLSVMWSPNIIYGLNYCIRLILNCLLYLLLVILLKNQSDIVRAIRTYIVISVITAITMLFSTLPLGSISKEYYLADGLTMTVDFITYQTRAKSFGYGESHFGPYILNFGILFAIGLLSQSKRKSEKMLMLVIICFLFWADLYSKARGPIASLLLAMIFLVFTIKDFRICFLRNFCVIAGCFIFLFGIFKVTSSYIMDYNKRFLPPVPIQGEHSLNDRFEMWGKAYNAIENNNAYIYGLGAGGGTYYVFPEATTHNIVLSIFWDFGLIGFILFFILMFIYITKLSLAIKNLKEDFAKAMLLSTSGCIIAFGLTSILDSNYNVNMLWFIMGLSTAIYRYAVSTSKESLSNTIN